MIQLDANYLILGTQIGTLQNSELRRWLDQGEGLSTSSIAWMEFVTGPVPPEVVDRVRVMLEGRILPVGADEAELAGEFYNILGRKRPLRFDCLIAATAVRAKARLATANAADFHRLVGHGLELAQ